MKDNEKAKKHKERQRTLKYMSVGMNMIYTLCTPMVLMGCLYYFVIEKKFGGVGGVSNCGMAHPYCNTGYKNGGGI